MPTVFEIIRRRWPEVMLIVVLHAAFFVFTEHFSSAMAPMPQADAAVISQPGGFFLGFAVVLFAILLQMVYLGFLATAAVTGAQPQEPGTLLSVGRRFFWRIFRFQLLLFLLLLAILTVIGSFVGTLFFNTESRQSMPEWAIATCQAIAMVAVVKPMLLVPAVMIVRDRLVMDAIGQLNRYRLGEMKPIAVHFVVLVAATSGLSVLAQLLGTDGIGHYATVFAHAALLGTGLVFIPLEMVCFVASRHVPQRPAGETEYLDAEYKDAEHVGNEYQSETDMDNRDFK